MPRPVLVLVSGHPGAGKTTLGRALGDAMQLPHLNRDRIRASLARTDPSSLADPRHRRSAVAYERWLAKLRADPQPMRESIAELEARVQAQRDEITNPLDLGVPIVEVETTEGYDPRLELVIAEIERLASD